MILIKKIDEYLNYRVRYSSEHQENMTLAGQIIDLKGERDALKSYLEHADGDYRDLTRRYDAAIQERDEANVLANRVECGYDELQQRLDKAIQERDEAVAATSEVGLENDLLKTERDDLQAQLKAAKYHGKKKSTTIENVAAQS